MLFIVSEVELQPRWPTRGAQERPRIAIERAGGRQVRALLALRAAVSAEPEWAGLCDRCQEALAETDADG